MQRQPRNDDWSGEYVIVRRREEKHVNARAILEKTFGKDDFSACAASRVGVDVRVLQELVGLGFVRLFEGRYDLKFRSGYLAGSFTVAVPFFKTDSDFMKRYGSGRMKPSIESKAHQESVERFFAEKLTDSSSGRSNESEPLNIFKRFRWRRSIYLLLATRYRNLSAYIRFLIYSDLGMTKEAEIERVRMGTRV